MSKLKLEIVELDGRVHCVYLDDHRIAGRKPWGGGQTVASFTVECKDLCAAMDQTTCRNCNGTRRVDCEDEQRSMTCPQCDATQRPSRDDAGQAVVKNIERYENGRRHGALARAAGTPIDAAPEAGDPSDNYYYCGWRSGWTNVHPPAPSAEAGRVDLPAPLPIEQAHCQETYVVCREGMFGSHTIATMDAFGTWRLGLMGRDKLRFEPTHFWPMSWLRVPQSQAALSGGAK